MECRWVHPLVNLWACLFVHHSSSQWSTVLVELKRWKIDCFQLQVCLGMRCLYRLGMGTDQVPWEQFEGRRPCIDLQEVGVSMGSPSEACLEWWVLGIWFHSSVLNCTVPKNQSFYWEDDWCSLGICDYFGYRVWRERDWLTSNFGNISFVNKYKLEIQVEHSLYHICYNIFLWFNLRLNFLPFTSHLLDWKSEFS